MQKALTKMNMQLANVISDISGVSGQAIVTAVIQGERDPYKLADLADYRVKASREEVARSLEGNWRADVLFELQQAVDSYHFAHRQMQECDDKLSLYLASLRARMREIPTPSQGTPETVAQRRKKAKKPRGNKPRMDMKEELKRICGVDLTSHRRHQCNDRIHGDLGNRHGHESLPGREPPHLVDGVGSGQRYQQRKNCGTRARRK